MNPLMWINRKGEVLYAKIALVFGSSCNGSELCASDFARKMQIKALKTNQLRRKLQVMVRRPSPYNPTGWTSRSMS
jgi:hypothetical protein